MTNDIITESSEGILRVGLNRPSKKNAMTADMYLALADIFNNAANNTEIGVVLWYGIGDSFSAGNDIEDFLKHPTVTGESPQARMFNALVDLEKPVVVAVHGAAIGGGTTMLTLCDFVYAAETTKFQLPFVNLALIPEFGSTYSIPARIGHIRAAELMLLGQPFDAHRALDLGLITQIVSDDKVLATATETAQKLVRKPSIALQAIKKLMKRSSREQLKETLKIEAEEFTLRLHSAETKEAFTAFLEKRAPNFAKK